MSQRAWRYYFNAVKLVCVMHLPDWRESNTVSTCLVRWGSSYDAEKLHKTANCRGRTLQIYTTKLKIQNQIQLKLYNPCLREVSPAQTTKMCTCIHHVIVIRGGLIPFIRETFISTSLNPTPYRRNLEIVNKNGFKTINSTCHISTTHNTAIQSLC